MKALLVIDVQQPYLRRYEGDLLARINRCIRQAAAQGELIVYIQNRLWPLPAKAAPPFAAGLEICSAHCFSKAKSDAFSNPQLAEFLCREGISTVELIGVDGNHCVAASAAGARKNGLQAALLCGCIGAKNKARFERTKRALAEQGVALSAQRF